MHCTVDILDTFFGDSSRETSFNMVREKIFLQVVKLWCTALFLDTAVTGDGCQNYTVLSDPTRAVSYVGSGNLQCDMTLQANWYRFVGQAGDRMLNYCPSDAGMRYRCQTMLAGWLNGQHPRVQDGEVTRTVCYSYYFHYGCCHWSNNVKVKNCGNYYVYRLIGTPHCDFRYCGNGAGKSFIAV